jgi:RNA polymerase sigma-70 factor (ECF subfamily)
MPPAGDEWVKKIEHQDPKAFDQLFLKYEVSVYRFAFYLTQNRREADDLFQETWLRVVKHLISKTLIRNFKAWIFTITMNVHRSDLRKKRVRRLFFSNRKIDSNMLNDHNPIMETAVVPKVSDASGEVELKLAMKSAISRLPLKQRQVFLLKEVEGFKHSEISEILNLPVGTIKSLLHRTIKYLQKELAEFHTH